MSNTRIYLVEMKNKKQFLVEATSKEQAIQKATAPQVKSCTIPTPLQMVALQAGGAELMVSTPATPPQTGGEGSENGGE